MTPKEIEESLATGMVEAVVPVLTTCDETVLAISTSQKALLQRMEELQNILDEYTNDSKVLPSFKEHAEKLKETRKRLTRVNKKLSTIQNRLDVVGKRLKPK
mmetsp:Transcript_10868/g.12417  ORF Transcript_10868/g.12417 Transcript_10868/m.12417 type:complete len:102 (-) Transcript_10868:550-855(-)